MLKIFKKEKKFALITVLLILFLLFAVTILIYKSVFVPLHVISAEILATDKNQANIENVKIKIQFNRPVNGEIINNFIESDPKTNFNVKFEQNALVISLLQNLNYNTKYSFTLSKELKDIYNNELGEDYYFEFNTKGQKFVYLQRNYPNSLDRIILFDLDSRQSFELFSAPLIQDYHATEEWLVVSIVNSKGTNDISIKSLTNNYSSNLKLENIKVSQISISKNNNEFLYVGQKIEEREINGQKFLAPNVSDPYNTLYLYSFNNTQTKIVSPNNTAEDIIDAKFTPDGSSILYRSNNQLNPGHYYLYPLENNLEVISLGFFSVITEFNKTADKLLFLSFDRENPYMAGNFIGILNSSRETQAITDGQKYVGEPIFGSVTNNIYYSINYKTIENSRGLFEIKYYNEGEKDLLKIDNFSLENPKVSLDEKYLAAEKITETELKNLFNSDNMVIARDFIDHKKPDKGGIVIFNLEKNEIMFEIANGIDLIWLK